MEGKESKLKVSFKSNKLHGDPIRSNVKSLHGPVSTNILLAKNSSFIKAKNISQAEM